MAKIRIAINGLGRIGKCITRSYLEYFDKYSEDLELVAVNVGSGTIQDRLHGIEYDSVHGRLNNDITIIDNDHFAFDNQQAIKMLFERSLSSVDWGSLGVDVVLECTGNLNDERKSHQHLRSGAKRVIVSAPYADADATIVLGANHHDFNPEKQLCISIGSCTTNCLAPVAKILNDNLGIESGFMTTIHSYTNDQLILDGSHKDKRRSRAASLSAIPSSTGAAKSIGLILPELVGKLDGAAIRIPTPNVSLIDFKFTVKKQTNATQINYLMHAESAKYSDILSISHKELVSCDFNHTIYSAIFDATLTKVIQGNFCRVVAWYDNEWAFSNRMLELAAMFRNKI
jgi:glyceraldehyde 3-phosphate dehydrogenase